MRRPLLFRAMDLLERALTAERLGRLLEAWILWRLRSPALREALVRNFRRIHGWAQARVREPGRELADEAAEALLRELASHYARERWTLVAIGRRPLELADGVDLDLLPALKGLLAGGRGAVLVSPHFGNLVLAMAALALSGVRLTASVVLADSYRWAEPWGLRLVSLGSGALDSLRALQNNEPVLVYGDMDFFPDRRTVPFFGAPYRPPQGPVRLAEAAGAPILPVYAVVRGGRCHFECDDPIPAGTDREAMESRILRSMEAWIARYPAQWLILRDAWNLEGSERRNRRQLHWARLMRGIDRLPGFGGRG